MNKVPFPVPIAFHVGSKIVHTLSKKIPDLIEQNLNKKYTKRVLIFPSSRLIPNSSIINEEDEEMDDEEDGDYNEDDEGNKLLDDFADDVETTDQIIR